MANKVKYQKQVWGTPIAGETLSVNGHYVGEHKGTPTQDALCAETTNKDARYIEANTIRYGTITQDAIEGSTPTKATE